MRSADIRRVRFGTIVRPAAETADGRARVEAIDGFLVPLPGGLLLFDTGIGAGDDEVDAHYRVRRVPLPAALAAAGAHPDEVTAVANCHLHVDHCGGNRALAGRPVFVQAAELALVRAGGHTVPDLVEHDGARIEALDGETRLAPHVTLVPTPGHTAGHQSLLVETDDGAVLLAGQTHDTASDWTRDAEAVRRPDPDLPPPPPWLPALLDRVAEARFAHDAAIWHR